MTTCPRRASAARRSAPWSGITYRQLDYWARTGLLRPSIADATGSGTQAALLLQRRRSSSR